MHIQYTFICSIYVCVYICTSVCIFVNMCMYMHMYTVNPHFTSLIASATLSKTTYLKKQFTIG